jgi:hypothetical protein
LSSPVALLVLATFATFFGFQLLLSVVPLYAGSTGGGGLGAGLATAAIMLSTVLTQVQTPRLLDRYAYRAMLAVGLERVMNSIRKGLGIGEREIGREPSRPCNPHFYAVFAQVHNTL